MDPFTKKIVRAWMDSNPGPSMRELIVKAIQDERTKNLPSPTHSSNENSAPGMPSIESIKDALDTVALCWAFQKSQGGLATDDLAKAMNVLKKIYLDVLLEK